MPESHSLYAAGSARSPSKSRNWSQTHWANHSESQLSDLGFGSGIWYSSGKIQGHLHLFSCLFCPDRSWGFLSWWGWGYSRSGCLRALFWFRFLFFGLNRSLEGCSELVIRFPPDLQVFWSALREKASLTWPTHSVHRHSKRISSSTTNSASLESTSHSSIPEKKESSTLSSYNDRLVNSTPHSYPRSISIIFPTSTHSYLLSSRSESSQDTTSWSTRL